MKYTKNTIENQTNNNTTNANNNNNIVNISFTSSTSSSSSVSSTSSSSSTASTTNGSSGCVGDIVNATSTAGNALFCEQVNTVTNLFEKWNDCERTVVLYALLKRLHYPCLKFLQYSIDNTLKQNMGSTSNLSTIVVEMNANNSSYLQNLLNAYKTFHLGDLVDTLSSSSSDKDSLPCYGSDFQITHCDERKLYNNKEDILHEVLNMLPLLKPGNEETKMIYLSLIPLAVKDTIKQIVPTELVQQIFSYMLIHPAVSNDDRRNLNVWLRHLEDNLQNVNSCSSLNMGLTTVNCNFMQNQNSLIGGFLLDNSAMTTSGSSATSSSSSAISIASTASNASVTSTSFGNLTQNCNGTSLPNNSSIVGSRNNDWQTIQPPCKQQQQQQLAKSAVGTDWPSFVPKPSTVANNTNIGNGGDNSIIAISSTISDQLCDNLNGITLNDLASSQNSLGLNVVGTSMVDALATVDGNVSSLVNGVAAAAASATAASVSSDATTPNIFGPQTNPIINIINNSQNCSGLMNGIEDHDTSFSKNGTEIVDFDPNTSAMNNCDGFNTANNSNVGLQPQQQMGYASILMSNCAEHLDITRWSLDSKFAALKTRRSNSLTTQTLSSSASSSNSSVITVNDNCSNSTENLAQFANKPRSYSLSIEHHRGSLTNSGSDTRLDDFKPNYIKFQTRNIGMSSIGLWLKSLRLHKYIELFKNMTYEEMLQITEEYLQSLGVTKGASHKLALCIEKLKDRSQNLIKMEQELINGQLKLQAAVEELANIVLTPMKPIELVNTNNGEDNIALNFLKVVDIVCSIAQKDPYTAVDDDNISVILWILDRSIHNEAFVNQLNQLKELKFKLSKLKMSLTPKIHHTKNGSNGNLNKPRWNGKTRKCEQKNGSNDRINHRKNSNDMLNFSLSCLQQQHHHNQQMQQQQQQQQQINEYDKYQSNNSNNNNSNNQFKNSAYQNYQQQQIKHQQQQMQQQQQQQQLQPQMLQQNTHFPALPQQQPQQQNRRSLNNLIVVSGGPQQPQKMVFKPGQGILSNTNMTTNDDLTIDMMKSKQQQSRKASLTSVNGNISMHNGTMLNVSNMEAQHQQQKQQSTTVNSPMQKNPITTVVMVSNDDLMHTTAATESTAAAAASTTANGSVIAPPPPPPQILITSNNTQTNHNVLLQQQQQQQHHAIQQQQQQLQLLAAAAAAVGNSCSLNVGSVVNNCSSTNNSNNANVGLVVANSSSGSSNIVLQQCTTNNNNNNCINSNNLNSCNNCNNHQLQINLKLPPLNESYQHHLQHHSPPTISDIMKTSLNNTTDPLNDFSSLEQLETLCLQMTEQAIN